MEDSVNIVPLLWKFGLLFFAIFGVVFVIALLTPWMARKIDALRGKSTPPSPKNDAPSQSVRGIYDLPPASDSQSSESEDSP